MNLGDKPLTTKEVSDALRVPLRTVQRLLNEGELPGFRIGGAWRVDPTRLNEYIHLQGTVSYRALVQLEREREFAASGSTKTAAEMTAT